MYYEGVDDAEEDGADLFGVGLGVDAAGGLPASCDVCVVVA